jgi:hypothetical protein
MRAEQDSPTMKKEGAGTSPTKTRKASKFASPNKKAKLKHLTCTVTKNDTVKKESGLKSPTSINMQSTFIIKNADESFDAYYA